MDFPTSLVFNPENSSDVDEAVSATSERLQARLVSFCSEGVPVA